jgi:hypothetical protein
MHPDDRDIIRTPLQEAIDLAAEGDDDLKKASDAMRAAATTEALGALVKAYLEAPTKRAETDAYRALARACEPSSPLGIALADVRSAQFKVAYGLRQIELHRQRDEARALGVAS